jgi:(p)ppGpp synthase/HD superfamily hydrolase
MHDRVRAARSFALEAHADQRYGTEPYQVHLSAVVAVLRRFGVTDPDLLAAAWCHDTLEDTGATREALEGAVGARAAELVWRVTNEAGHSRKERNTATYPKLVADQDAVRVKLADRIANVEACWASRSNKLFTYHGEYPSFRAALRVAEDETLIELWAHLDELLAWREPT